MPKVENNNLLKGVSGLLGDNFVIRQTPLGTILANKPKKSRVTTDEQRAVRNRFSYAAYYAREQMKREAREMYRAAVTPRLSSPYKVAMSDFLSVPKIDLVDVRGYRGAVGDVITVRAWDDFRVTSVSVVIKSASGEELEHGEAVFSTGLQPEWLYTVTTANASLEGTTITATAKDIPGNETVRAITL